MMILNKLPSWAKKILNIEEQELRYPIPYAIVKYTSSALEKNIQDDQNKLIYKYFYNKYGNLDLKKYKYSQAMINIIRNQGVPVYDKTKSPQQFPVFVEELPAHEIVYHSV